MLKFTVPIGVVCAGFGVFLMLGSHAPADPGFAPRHAVTKKMETITGAWARRVAPPFLVTDVAKKPVSLDDMVAKGPVFLYFIKDGCPCSVDAQPLFNHLRDKFKGKVSFIGVIDADAKKGAKWAKINAMTDPLLGDSKLEVIHAYKATNSAFSTLVLRDGTIQKMWPGYSRDFLLDMNKQICDALGEPVTPFDPLYAPLAKTAGCYFERD